MCSHLQARSPLFAVTLGRLAVNYTLCVDAAIPPPVFYITDWYDFWWLILNAYRLTNAQDYSTRIWRFATDTGFAQSERVVEAQRVERIPAYFCPYQGPSALLCCVSTSDTKRKKTHLFLIVHSSARSRHFWVTGLVTYSWCPLCFLLLEALRFSALLGVECFLTSRRPRSMASVVVRTGHRTHTVPSYLTSHSLSSQSECVTDVLFVETMGT